MIILAWQLLVVATGGSTVVLTVNQNWITLVTLLDYNKRISKFWRNQYVCSCIYYYWNVGALNFANSDFRDIGDSTRNKPDDYRNKLAKYFCKLS